MLDNKQEFKNSMDFVNSKITGDYDIMFGLDFLKKLFNHNYPIPMFEGEEVLHTMELETRKPGTLLDYEVFGYVHFTNYCIVFSDPVLHVAYDSVHSIGESGVDDRYFHFIFKNGTFLTRRVSRSTRGNTKKFLRDQPYYQSDPKLPSEWLKSLNQEVKLPGLLQPEK